MSNILKTRFYIEIVVKGINKPFKSKTEDVRIYTARTFSNSANISIEQAWARVDRYVDDITRFKSDNPIRITGSKDELYCFNPEEVVVVILHKLD